MFKGVATLGIIEGKTLPASFADGLHAACIVSLQGKQKQSTKVVLNTLDPYWNDNFQIYTPDPKEKFEILIQVVGKILFFCKCLMCRFR